MCLICDWNKRTKVTTTRQNLIWKNCEINLIEKGQQLNTHSLGHLINTTEVIKKSQKHLIQFKQRCNKLMWSIVHHLKKILG